MKISHVSYHDISGGAALAAYRLHAGLNSIGLCSTMVVRKKTSLDETVLTIAADQPEDIEHAEVVRQTYLAEAAGLPVFSQGGFVLFHTERSPVGRALDRQLAGYDVVNLHWVRAVLDWQTFFPSRPSSQVVVWTLHDMHPFTGGCHYGAGCGGYTAACGACPVLESGEAEDLSTQVQRRKISALRLFTGRRLHIVSPSRWLADQAAASTVFQGLPITVIPYSLDTTLFRPRDRAAKRKALGIGAQTRVIFFVAHSVTDVRKGLDVIDDALCRLGPREDVLVLIAGEGHFGFRSAWPTRHLGPIASADDLAELYSAADLTVVPSREDNLPNTVLESLACGTAVLGSRIGGIPDMISEGDNGLLAPVADGEAWAAALGQALTSREELAAMGRRARLRADRDHALDVQPRRYRDLYERLLEPTAVG